MLGLRRLARGFGFLLALVAIAANAGLVRAQAKMPQAFPKVSYEFGDHIRFVVRFEPAQSVKSVTLLYHPAQATYTLTAPMKWDAAAGKATFTHNLHQKPLPPFSKIFYWFRVETKNGGHFTTASFSFTLADNRYKWQSVSAPPFKVFWYKGGVEVAQQAVNAAAEGLVRAQEIWLAPTPKQVNIYIYADSAALQTALGAKSWVAAHASPELGALFISLPPMGQTSEIRRLVPHELAHYLLYQETGIGYRTLPVWFNEGLASVNELSPLPDYEVVLRQAVADGRLIPMRDLCNGFPSEAGAALLAYAESASFVRYLSHRYGRVAMHNLVDAYAQGIGCDVGARRVLGRNLSDLERDWRAGALGISEWGQALSNLSPWLLTAAALLISLALGAWAAKP